MTVTTLQPSSLKRVVVIGNSCAGKTTFANTLALQLGCPVIDLDELFWAQNWTPKPSSEFIKLTTSATANDRWIVAGNFSVVRDIVWSRATHIVWLNYDLPTVVWRALRRTSRRLLTQEELWHGNRESFKRTFLSRDSILLWVISTFKKNRLKYTTIQEENQYQHLTWITFEQPRDATLFLENIRNPS